MTDVLIVCVREDEVQAKALADLFEREGMSVGGAPADDSALRTSGAIVVIWSQASIRSRPFLDASQRVVNAGKAVFACLIDPPPASSLNQSPWFDLKQWNGSPDDPTVDPLFFAVDRMVNAAGGSYAAPAPEPSYQAPQFENRGYSQQASPPPYARARPLAPAPAPRYEPPQPSARRAEREPADPMGAEALRWKAIRHSRDPTAFLNYLTEYGADGAFSELAELRLKQLQEANTTPLKAAARAVETQARRPAAPAPLPPPRREPPAAREREPEPAYAAAPAYAPPVREYRDFAPPPERRSAGGGAMRFVILFALLGAGAIGAGMYFGTGQQLGPEAPAYAAQEEPTPGQDVAELSAPAALPSATAVGGPTEVEENAFDALPQRAPAARQTPARETVAADDPRNAAAAPRFERVGADPAPSAIALMPQPVAPAPQQMAALSPPAAPPIARRGIVVWQTRASAAQFSAVYPQNARRADISGRVQLSCVIQADYSAACAVANESPGGYGFGQAALRVARSYRARPTLDDGTPSPGSDARLNITFQAAE